MINSKDSYKHFLSEDKKALNIVETNKISISLNPYNIDLEIWRFQIQLRKCEYLYNLNKKNILWKLKKFFAARLFKKLSCKLGFTIDPNCFGEGLRIAHRGTIVVNGRARIGTNCTINACVNIGATPGFDDAVPTIGNNVYIGPGAKIYGKIYIADGCIIGANAVVNKDCLETNMLLIGIPAIARKPKSN
ncbi:serine O-acetyltransferase [Dyadobacter psychrotolerans]|uniref:Serine acetyltransferase n=1 Tax=Dyadobacter psychrotolerans TaxID=2541721 RepID=A0A4R5D961_9BACT|nr:serine acetyltransferase [Dyadobacter psychrotolerans]TDE08430.1 serine acetyltransferase [Dyadobacter psychrotolerans]